jgi:hypothetical protein
MCGHQPIVSVLFASIQFQKIRTLNEALRNAGDERRVHLLSQLFTLWVSAGVNGRTEDNEDALVVFGEVFELYGKNPLLYTLTVDHQQMCIWHGPPGNFTNGRVLGNDEHILFGVYSKHANHMAPYMETVVRAHQPPGGEQVCHHVRVFGRLMDKEKKKP